MPPAAEMTAAPRPARWTSLLHGAASESAVVLIVREYLQTWTPSELQALPIVIDSNRLHVGQDVSDLAVELVHAELKFRGDGHATETLREITAVVREAAARFPRFSWEAKLIGGK